MLKKKRKKEKNIYFLCKLVCIFFLLLYIYKQVKQVCPQWQVTCTNLLVPLPPYLSHVKGSVLTKTIKKDIQIADGRERQNPSPWMDHHILNLGWRPQVKI